MTKFYIISFLVGLSFFSCKTATKAYDKGNYTDAVELAVKKLQKDPYDAEAKSVLQKAYNYAVSLHEDKIRILSHSNSDNRWEQIYHEYSILQNLYETVKQNPSSAQTVKAMDYSNFVQTYRDKTVESHFEKGLNWMKEENRTAYREAYGEFKKALRYKPDDFAIRQKADSAYQAAILKVIILPIDNYNGYSYTNNNYGTRLFQDEVLRNLNYSLTNDFVKFYSEWDARNNRIEPDEVLELRLGYINLGRPYDEHTTREVSKEVVIKETVYKPDSVVKQYGKVYAKIISTKRTLVSNLDMFVTTRNINGRILWNDQFRGEHRWQTEFATYQGDERALSTNDKNLINKTAKNPPREDDIMDHLLSQVQNDLTYRLRNYYNRYN